MCGEKESLVNGTYEIIFEIWVQSPKSPHKGGLALKVKYTQMRP